MYALKDGCVHPYTGVPYINSVTDNVSADVMRVGSGSNTPCPLFGQLLTRLQGQNTHAFAVRFRTASEREYFLQHDPAHHELQKDVAAFVERVTMFDYTDDVLPSSTDRAYSKA